MGETCSRTLKWDTNSVENIREDEMMFTCSIWLVNHGLHYSSSGINEPENTGEKQDPLHHLPSQTQHVADIEHLVLVALAVSSIVVLQYEPTRVQDHISGTFRLGLELDSNELVLANHKRFGLGHLRWTRLVYSSTVSPDKPENNIHAQTQEFRKVCIWWIWDDFNKCKCLSSSSKLCPQKDTTQTRSGMVSPRQQSDKWRCFWSLLLLNT